MEKKTERRSWRRKLLYALVIVTIVALVFFFISRENLSQMVQTLQGTDYRLFLLALGVYFFGMVLWALRFKTALLACHQKVTMKSGFLVVLGSVFINNITPFTYSGGDPFARSFLLKKVCNTPYLCCFASLLSEFLIDFPIFLSLFVWGFFLKEIQLISILLIIAWAAGLSIFVLVTHHMFHRNEAPRKITGFIWRIGRIFKKSLTENQVEGHLRTFIMLVGGILKHRRYFAMMVFVALAFWTLVISRFLLIFGAFGYQAPIPMLMLTLTLSSVVGLIPILPAGLGTVDFTYVSIFTLFGVPLPLALSVVLLERLISLVIGTLVGGFALSYLGIKSWTKFSSS